MPIEQPIVFDVGDDAVVGVLHQSEHTARTGVVIIVGGPQYRIGSHRQFLILARDLCAGGFDVLRFDYRGMGDSAGDARTFEDIEGDIRAAVDEIYRRRPSLRHVLLLGLCDGATAALLYAPSDQRIRSLVMINPWARSNASHAQVTLRSYYLRRLLSPTFWRKLVHRQVAVRQSIADAAQTARAAHAADDRPPYLTLLDEAARTYCGPLLLILSGNDLTADEFASWASGDAARAAAFRRESVQRVSIAVANHTFSSASLRVTLSDRILAFCREQTLRT